MIILRLKKSLTLRLTCERVNTPLIRDWIFVAASWARESSSSCIVMIMMINTIRKGEVWDTDWGGGRLFAGFLGYGFEGKVNKPF